MIDFSHLLFDKLAVHYVGNRASDDGVMLSEKEHDLMDDQLQVTLFDYFFSSFKKNDTYRFNDSSFMLNLIDHYWVHGGDFMDVSKRIAEHLYNNNNDPRDKPVQLYIAAFRDVLLNDELVDAIGIFQQEASDKKSFLNVNKMTDSQVIGYHQGFDASKISKGVLVFNSNREDGLVVKVSDKMVDDKPKALALRNTLLDIKPADDDFMNTKKMLIILADFLDEVAMAKMGGLAYISYIGKALEYFGTQDWFHHMEFAAQVFNSEELVSDFNDYLLARGLRDADKEVLTFDISQAAFKQYKSKFKPEVILDDCVKISVKPSQIDYFLKNSAKDKNQDGLDYYKINFQFESK